jgi:hypothetical protein
LKALTGEISAEKFEEKFREVAGRAKVKVQPNRIFSRERVGKPKRFFPLPRMC